MRLLSLCWVVILSCSQNLAAAATGPLELLSTRKVMATETSKNTGVTTHRLSVTRDRLMTASARSSTLSSSKQGADTQMVEPKKQNESAKSQSAFSGTIKGDRIKQLDRKAAEAVTEFFRQEGDTQLIKVPEKQIRIANVLSDSDFPDRRIVTVDQYVQGVPVFGSRTAVKVVFDKKGAASIKKVNGVPSVSGRLVSQDKLIDLNTIPVVSWTEAIDRALNVYRQERPSRHASIVNGGHCAVKVQLTVFDPTIFHVKDDKARLAWYVRVNGVVVFIDAQDGSSIFHYDDNPSAFDGLRIYDVDGGDQDQCVEKNTVLDENGPYPGAPSVSADSDNNAARAQAEAKNAYQFFKKLGWDSYDNNGSAVKSCVRVTEGNWPNRFGQWDTLAHCIYFYPGLPHAQDIAGHEFTHGVIQFMPTLKPNPTNPSGGLLLASESGALSEALADFFGSRIEGLNWNIGENVPPVFFDSSFLGEGTNSLPLRNMADPHKGTTSTTQCIYPVDQPPPGFYPNCAPFGWNQGQPDHYTEIVDHAQDICWYDRDCIHLNSGIFNKAMYLAANGGDHHSVHVEAIGNKKLVKIMFWTLRNQTLSADIGMKAFAETSHEACTELSAKKKYKILQTDCDQVKNAFVAVGLMSP